MTYFLCEIASILVMMMSSCRVQPLDAHALNTSTNADEILTHLNWDDMKYPNKTDYTCKTKSVKLISTEIQNKLTLRRLSSYQQYLRIDGAAHKLCRG